MTQTPEQTSWFHVVNTYIHGNYSDCPAKIFVTINHNNCLEMCGRKFQTKSALDIVCLVVSSIYFDGIVWKHVYDIVVNELCNCLEKADIIISGRCYLHRG